MKKQHENRKATYGSQTERKIIVVDESEGQTIELVISGMTCNGCTEHVNQAINKLMVLLAQQFPLTKETPWSHSIVQKSVLTKLKRLSMRLATSNTQEGEIKWKSQQNQSLPAQIADTKKKKKCLQMLASISTSAEIAEPS